MSTIPAETLRDWDHAHLWHPFTPLADWAAADPLIIERAEGVYLFDTEGRRYLDGVSSLWCNVHGHRHPALDAAIRDQLDKVAHSTLLGVTHPPAIELARRLVELRARGPDPRLLLRRRGDGRRGRAQDGVPVLAAEARPRAEADAVHRPRGRLPRRHARRRQRRRRRAVPRDVRPAAVPVAPGAEPALLPLPARPGAARLRDRLPGRGRAAPRAHTRARSRRSSSSRWCRGRRG